AWRLAAIRTQYGDTAAVRAGLLHVHRTRQRHVRALAGLRRLQHLEHDLLTVLRVAEAICDPDVALAVDRHSARAEANLEGFHLARVRRGESRDPVGGRVRDPDAVFLVNGEVERRDELAGVLPGVAGLVLEEQFAPGRVALGHEHDLTS